MPFTGPIEDRLLIRELYNGYADAAFRSDRQAWLDCWADDGQWTTGFGTVSGKHALNAQWDAILKTFSSMAFFTELGAIEVSGERASGRAYCREILNLPDGRIRKFVGRYDDELVRENGAWRFARRDYKVLIVEEPPQ